MEPRTIFLAVFGFLFGAIALYKWRKPSKKPVFPEEARLCGFFALFSLWGAFLSQGRFPEPGEVVMMLFLGIVFDYVTFYGNYIKNTVKRP